MARSAKIGRREWMSGALSLVGLASGDAGCVRSCPVLGQWNNAVGTESVRPSLLMFPSEAGEIVGIVQQAEKARKRVRMTGSGHSFSDIALNDDYLLLPSRLDAPLAIDRARLRPAYANDIRLV